MTVDEYLDKIENAGMKTLLAQQDFIDYMKIIELEPINADRLVEIQIELYNRFHIFLVTKQEWSDLLESGKSIRISRENFRIILKYLTDITRQQSKAEKELEILKNRIKMVGLNLVQSQYLK